jgi:hypothetical protein
MAAAAGYAADTASLLASFVAQHPDSARFDEFKHVWCAPLSLRRLSGAAPSARGASLLSVRRRTKCFSLIHMARPHALTDEQFTQALYAAAIALLRGGSEDTATSQGVDANDAGVLYALLLLFRTQHCVPPVPVYVPIGAATPRRRMRRSGAALRRVSPAQTRSSRYWASTTRRLMRSMRTYCAYFECCLRRTRLCWAASRR